MDDTLTLETLIDPADVRLAAVVNIYLTSFPASERKPTPCFLEMINRPGYAVIVAMIGQETVGFAAVFVPEHPTDAALLEYVAVDAVASGKGIGTALVRSAAKLAEHRPLLMEVESAGDVQADRRRRFYRRLDARRVMNFRYILPMPDAPPMELFVLQPTGPLTSFQVQRWLIEIYTKVYACSASDPRLMAMTAELFPSVELEPAS